ncbi:MAG: glycoside hydrolase family 3 C-terminal domain-containing protein [Oscillospiraceae bacterium]|nr:glycoside hydrolase family 3 C-terminal domain-containing protein [Oscillospiraceae bacterium]
MFKKPNLYRGLACVFAFLLVISILASNILEVNRTMVDQTFKTQSELVITEENDNSLFTAFIPDPDFMTGDKLDIKKDEAVHKELGTLIQEEGTVLLKNEGSALPLASGAKITVLGKYGYMAAGGGRGGSAVTPAAGLEAAGLQLNPVVSAIYGGMRLSSAAPGWASNKTYDFKYNPGEISVADIAKANGDYQNSFSEYGDACLVFLGRGNGEGADYKPGAEGVADGVGSRNALALSTNERDLINLATSNFKKVIVLVSTVSPMELGEVQENPAVNSILWIGHTATYGAYGLGNIIAGKANPSGGLYDTYAHNSMSSPAMRNMGHYEFTNADQIDRKDTSSVGTRGTDPGFKNYVIEAESIYVGYRYYETRYYDCVLGQGNASVKTDSTGIYEDSRSGWNYAEEVVYPFGYGLSYTTFEKTIENVTWTKTRHEQIAHVTVLVKNTGSVAGKTSVQIYGQAPYTDYDKQNLVEKSAIQLLNFDKTDIIQPGQSVTVTVDVDLQNLASYDGNAAKTYIMENSDQYYFAVGNGAHDALNNVLAAQGKTVSNGMDYNGNAKGAWKWTYSTATTGTVDSFTFGSSKAGVEITNQLQYSNWNDYEPGKVQMLTRQDWAGTFPKTYDTMTAPALMVKHYSGQVIEYHTKDNPDSAEALAAVKFDQPTDLKFASMKGASYDDYRWEEVIDAMSLEEVVLCAIKSGRGFAGIDSLNFPTGSYAENGPGTPVWLSDQEGALNAPWAIATPERGSYNLGSFPTFSVLGSTFSPHLASEYGRVLANDAILGGKPMMWLPGANTHRTPYNGRSEQYFSEDPILTGVVTMEAAVAALNKGGIVTAKHFAFNDQEMHRSGVGTFMTEQRAREVELRAFQIPFEAAKYDTPEKDVGMLGVMTSFSKLGGIECTVNKGLLTGILAGEWNYRGYIVSDLKDDLDLMPQAFLAGLGGYDWRTEKDDVDPYSSVEDFRYDAELLKAMKNVCRQKLCTFANSSFMNRVNTSTHTVRNMTWWRTAYTAGIIGSAVLTGLAVILYAVSAASSKKKEG